ncbi:hypothetical protein EVAR_17225_1 [Eumeta japonica]|uniref:Uncharacterized protein n=1 Tax=Eumeta variegata TaxID=151549 RepID=A0A4C1U936_EUMVA|nr:hypothetical protein EVAR_17225_1 [Eumeta japonica]
MADACAKSGRSAGTCGVRGLSPPLRLVQTFLVQTRHGVFNLKSISKQSEPSQHFWCATKPIPKLSTEPGSNWVRIWLELKVWPRSKPETAPRPELKAETRLRLALKKCQHSHSTHAHTHTTHVQHRNDLLAIAPRMEILRRDLPALIFRNVSPSAGEATPASNSPVCRRVSLADPKRVKFNTLTYPNLAETKPL